MTTSVGHYGDGIRGDAEVVVSDAAVTGYEMASLVESIYGASLRRQIESCLDRFGSPPVHLTLRDSGALPFAIEARLEAALSTHLSVPLPALPPRELSPSGRSRRTRLYVPGNTPKLFANVGLYRPDAIILDLEDSVPTPAKLAARAMVRRALQALDWDLAERCVRINAGPQGLEDVRAVALQGVHTFLVPKTEEPESLRAIAALLDDLDVPSRLLPILESAKGVLRAYEIASATPRVVAIALGLEDYVADIQAERTEEGLESVWAHGQVVNAARAAGVSPLASVYSKIDAEEGMLRYAARARALGFDGVGCVHPRQIAPAHAAFAPSPDELEHAQQVVEEFERALTDGVGAIQVAGKMVDAPVYERSKRLLERAE